MAQLAPASLRRMGAAAVGLGLALCVVPTAAQATSSRSVCLSFRATGTGQDLGGGHTKGMLLVGRHQIGATEAFFVLGPGTAPAATFTGPLIFTPDRGPASTTLVAQLDGTFDMSSGSFGARSTSLTGTGALGAVSGRLRVVDGLENHTTGAFTETLVGRLCTPVGGRHALERAIG
jgi:hypothetical protein